MFNKSKGIPEVVRRDFGNIIERIETDGIVMADKSIVLEVTRIEYLNVKSYWSGFKIYVETVTGKWTPAFAGSSEGIEGSIFDCEYFVVFRPSTLARIHKFFNNSFKPIDNRKLQPAASKVAPINNLLNKKNFL